MDQWNSIAERKIREAMDEGVFDNLAGKGRPLDLEEAPYEDPSLRMAHRLLRNNGFAPPWVEERREILADIDRARVQFERSAEGSRDRALKVYRERIQELNRRIAVHNLKTAAATLHLRPVDVSAAATPPSGPPRRQS